MNRVRGASIFGEVYPEYSGLKGRNVMNSKVKFDKDQVRTIPQEVVVKGKARKAGKVCNIYMMSL